MKDWLIADYSSFHTNKDAFCGGSVGYAAPEVFSNKTNIDWKEVDKWALGVILFILVTECHPWKRATMDDKHFAFYVNNYSNNFWKKYLKQQFTIPVEYDLDFYQLGFSERENLLPIAPSECSVVLDLDLKGNVVRLSQNAGVALPNATVAGYVPPNTLDDPAQKFISHVEGDGTGDIDLEVVDPYAVLDNHT